MFSFNSKSQETIEFARNCCSSTFNFSMASRSHQPFASLTKETDTAAVYTQYLPSSPLLMSHDLESKKQLETQVTPKSNQIHQPSFSGLPLHVEQVHCPSITFYRIIINSQTLTSLYDQNQLIHFIRQIFLFIYQNISSLINFKIIENLHNY